MKNWIKLEGESIGHLVPLFKDMKDTCILSCLQGKMGQCWADDENLPTAAALQVGDFCFLAGDCNAKGTREMMKRFYERFGRETLFVIVEKSQWGDQLLEVYQKNCEKITRYGIKKKTEPFDCTLLERKIKNIQEPFEIVKADENIYYQMLKEEWSKDFCANFQSVSDYMEHGLGVVALYKGKIVAGTSSYTWYEQGYEIEVVTKEAFRRKGLATATSAAFILECQKRRKYPSWDAANMASVHLAESLGYEFEKEYDTYRITFS